MTAIFRILSTKCVSVTLELCACPALVLVEERPTRTPWHTLPDDTKTPLELEINHGRCSSGHNDRALWQAICNTTRGAFHMLKTTTSVHISILQKSNAYVSDVQSKDILTQIFRL
eukprot:m.378875 g.378875  ORF g.378875 m.378875 type:complete len:115 (+) comp20939_c0_seq2:2210-2554(+)